MRIAIVGCGEIARVHIPFIMQDARRSIVALCDADPNRAETLAASFGIKRTYTNFGELLEAQKPDVVHVLTPPQSHASLALQALQAKSHVLVEKPMALSVQEADAMIATAKAHNVRLCVNHNQLFDPVVLKARRLVDEGMLGPIIAVESYYGFQLVQAAERQWVNDLPGGIFQNLAPHPLSLILQFLHDPLELYAASLASGTLGPDIPDELRVLIKSKDSIGTVSISLGIKPHLNFVRLYGSRAVLHVDLANMILATERLRRLPKAPARGLMNLEYGGRIAFGAVGNAFKLIFGQIKRYPGLGNLLHRFYESIDQGHEAPVTGEAGRRVVQVFERVRTMLPTPVIRAGIPGRQRKGAPRVFITGATGFLGSRLVEKLVELGNDVSALVRSKGGVERLKARGVDCVEGDLQDAEVLKRAVEGCEVVYHCAATTHGSWDDYLAGTIRGTERLLEASAAARVKRFVYISSLSVYAINESNGHSLIAEDAPLEPHPEQRGYYTQSKVEAEKLVLAYRERAQVPITILRPGTIYGPHGKVFFPRIGYSLNNKIFVIIGRGTNVLPLVYIDNVVDAICLSASREVAAGQIYNIVDDDPITQREYVNNLIEQTRLTAFTMHVPVKAMFLAAFCLEASATLIGRAPVLSRYRLTSATKNVCYDTSNAKNQLGWKPAVSLEEGLKRTFQWYRKEHDHR